MPRMRVNIDIEDMYTIDVAVLCDLPRHMVMYHTHTKEDQGLFKLLRDNMSVEDIGTTVGRYVAQECKRNRIYVAKLDKQGTTYKGSLLPSFCRAAREVGMEIYYSSPKHPVVGRNFWVPEDLKEELADLLKDAPPAEAEGDTAAAAKE